MLQHNARTRARRDDCMRMCVYIYVYTNKCIVHPLSQLSTFFGGRLHFRDEAVYLGETKAKNTYRGGGVPCYKM